jgi:exodeoxyribonuclease VII large subunit
VVALNFPEAIWLHCEIAQCSTNRGHLYLTLIQKDEHSNEIIAQSNAIVWERNLRQLYQKYGRTVLEVLSEGTEAHLQVKVSFHERYGMSLSVEDVDASYTLGKLALQRRKTIELLTNEGLIHQQQTLILPKVIQKIAVLSSENAAGWIDFKTHLAQNIYQYAFDLTLFKVAVQGNFAAKEIKQQLQAIAFDNDISKPYDAVILVRGGGAKTDLMAFDDADLCRTIATFPIPILVGIGHEIDETVLDFVAHASLKTPTAVADFLLEHNGQFESEILSFFNKIQFIFQQKQHYNTLLISDLEQKITFSASYIFKRHFQDIERLNEQVLSQAQRILLQEDRAIHFVSKLIESHNPERILQRGFTLTLQNGKALTSVAEVNAELPIETHFKDGKQISHIN